MKPTCVISCPILTVSGYGARARDFVKAILELKGSEWDIKVLPQRWGHTNWFKPEGEHSWIAPLIIQQLHTQPDYFFQITVPNEAQPIGKLFNCMVTAGIETDTCAPEWIEGINKMDLTLVSSEHAKSVFENAKYEKKDERTGQTVGVVALNKPIEVLFEGVDLTKYFPMTDSDLPEDDVVYALDDLQEEFCFLMVGHWLQGSYGHDRKNIGHSIAMFLEAFKGQKNMPALVIKTSSGPTSITDRDEILSRISKIRESVDGKDLPNVYLLYGEIEDEQINFLYNHPKIKAMLYFGHGEGYGRPLAEFTQAKKPIIASNWSGHVDFLGDKAYMIAGQTMPIDASVVVPGMLVEGSKWFYVDPNLCIKAMQDVYKNYTKHIDMGKRLAYNVKTNFSYDAMKAKLAERLNALPKPVALKLPQLKKIELPKLTPKKELLKD